MSHSTEAVIPLTEAGNERSGDGRSDAGCPGLPGRTRGVKRQMLLDGCVRSTCVALESAATLVARMLERRRYRFTLLGIGFQLSLEGPD